MRARSVALFAIGLGLGVVGNHVVSPAAPVHAVSTASTIHVSPRALYAEGYSGGVRHVGHVPTNCGTASAGTYTLGYCDAYADSERAS